MQGREIFLLQIHQIIKSFLAEPGVVAGELRNQGLKMRQIGGAKSLRESKEEQEGQDRAEPPVPCTTAR